MAIGSPWNRHLRSRITNILTDRGSPGYVKLPINALLLSRPRQYQILSEEQSLYGRHHRCIKVFPSCSLRTEVKDKGRISTNDNNEIERGIPLITWLDGSAAAGYQDAFPSGSISPGLYLIEGYGI